MSKNNLGILVLDNFKEFGKKVQKHLQHPKIIPTFATANKEVP